MVSQIFTFIKPWTEKAKSELSKTFSCECVGRLSFLFGKISINMMFLGSTIKKLQIKTSNPTRDFLIHFPCEVKSRVLWGQK